MIEEITGDILLVKGVNNGAFPFSHSIIVLSDDKDAVLIDTGCGIDTLKELKRRFRIKRIINSHTHPDHSAGNWLFNDDGVSISVPREGFATAGNILRLSERFTEPGYLAEYWRGWVSEKMSFKDMPVDDCFDSDSTFHFGDVILKPIYTPGHTIDHYCLYEPERKILFAFDYDLTRFGPWYGHRESNIGEFKDSIMRIMGLEIDIFVSGHKGIITDDIEGRLERYLLKFDENEGKILKLLSEGNKTIGELTDRAPIYGGFPYAMPLLRYWEGNMIKMHLDELVNKGLIIKGEKDRYSV